MAVAARARARARPVLGAASTIAERWHALRTRYEWWQITLFIVGVIAALSVFGALFFAVGNKPPRIYTDDTLPSVDTAEFTTTLATLVGSPVERGGTIDILNNGEEFVPALLRSLDDATSSINFSVYIWSDGTMSDRVLRVLEKKQREGVTVRVLLDGLGALRIPDKKFEPLIESGGRVRKYRTPKFGKLTRFHRRNHRRSIVIDGEIGFTGGMAVGDQWLGVAQDPEHWRDMMFKVTGPLARSLQSAFADTWVDSSGEILVAPRNSETDAAASSRGAGRFVHLVNSPADDDQSMAYFFLLPILSARQSIYLASPYFIPDHHLLSALVEKAKAGVDVRLLLPGAHTDNWITRASSHARYQELLEAGVKIYEYGPTFLHAKLAVIDGGWSIIGSPNLNTRSRELDEENAIGIYDPAFAARLQQGFVKDLQKSEQMHLEQWRARHPLRKALETVSQILDQQS